MDELSKIGFEWHALVRNDSDVHTDSGPLNVTPWMAYSKQGPPYLELLEQMPGTIWAETGLHHLGVWADDVLADAEQLVATLPGNDGSRRVQLACWAAHQLLLHGDRLRAEHLLELADADPFGATAGQGLVLARWSLVADDLAAGRLAMASEFAIPYGYDCYFACPPAYLALPKVQALREWLLSHAAKVTPPPSR